MVRDFLSVLDILRDNPGMGMVDLVKGPNFQPRSAEKDQETEEAGDFKEFVL